jgi:DNA sulfur modification protein DndD
MKLISLRLCNFRQFYGKTPEIKLAAGEKNATIIHGNNGAGKTTILNAFTWILYERFTPAFGASNLLINKRAILEANNNASVECWGELQFEHDGKRYQIKRKCYGTKNSHGEAEQSKTQLFMLIAGDDGCWYHPLQLPEEIIEGILPVSLHQYFFFDGEQIDLIFRYGKNNNLAEDTKELLGIKVLERSIEHLKKAGKNLQEELGNIGDFDTKKLLREKAELEVEKNKLEGRQQDIVRELKKKEELKKQLNEQILALSGAEEFKRVKEDLERQEKIIRQNLIRSKTDLKKYISQQGYLVFLDNRIQKFNRLLNNLRDREEFNLGIKPQLIDKLIAQKRCLCGTELNENTPAFDRVFAWKQQTETVEIETAIVRLEATVAAMQEKVKIFTENVDREQHNIQQWRGELAQIENRLDEIKTKFRTYPDLNIQELQQQLDRQEDIIKDLILERGGNRQQLEIIQKQVEIIIKQIGKDKLKEDKQILTEKRIDFTQKAIATLVEVRNRIQVQFRLSLENKVREIFNSISFTPYQPQLSSNYELTLVENTSGINIPVAASTGENQILSLSFIGAILDRVREWSQKHTLMGLDSSTLPIVMDSPFGSLDEVYRRQVARSLPQLANQLIVLATKTQWRGEVAAEMERYIGKEYILIYHSPKLDCELDNISIRNSTYPFVKLSDSQYEYTEIVEAQ